MGDYIDVEVIFVGDGTRFSGSPPYLFIYVGAPTPENERRAVWHSAEDTNSTKVIFRYTVQSGDDTSKISIKPNSLTIPPGSAITDDAGNIFFSPVGGAARTLSTPAYAKPTAGRVLRPSPVAQDRIIFNELRNASDDKNDWIELKTSATQKFHSKIGK